MKKARSPVAEANQKEQNYMSRFLQHCPFCGEICAVARDPKHPDRWRPAYVCREGETFVNRGLREAIFEVCEKNTVPNLTGKSKNGRSSHRFTCSRREVSC